MTDRKLPPGRHVYDAFNGLRVGGVSGLLAGTGLAVLTGLFWLMLVDWLKPWSSRKSWT